MGVVRKLHASRLASQLAFMLIEHIRRGGTTTYGMKRAEIGWILEDNKGMISIADAIEATCQPRLSDLRKGAVDRAPAHRAAYSFCFP